MYIDSVWQLTGKAFLVFGVVAFLIQWLLPRWKKYKHNLPNVENQNKDVSVKRRKQAESREKLQEQHDVKAVAFSENILVPREDAKKKRKDADFQRFSGPAWKGEGHELGGDEYCENVDTDSTEVFDTNKSAARRRKLPEPDVSLLPQTPVKEKTKIIILPDEPEAGSTDCITVVLRTPIGRLYKRRFLHHHTIQVILDYMTTVGFSQSIYTLSTSYPRRNLACDCEKTLLELQFKTQVTLNVEEEEEV